MRTYVLILATLGLLGGAFAFYCRSQPPVAGSGGTQVHHAEPPPATRPASEATSLQRGDAPWVKMIDADGKVASQYRAREYLPRPDGTVHLISPEADFFVGQHERLHVTGVNGDVVMHSSTSISLSGNSQPSGQPTRGRLNDVTMTLIDESILSQPVIVLTMTANNIEFDNDSFLITTGGYTSPDGKSVPPDQVPVQVRGEYEFNGRGLTLRWNDHDDRLELLEIAHGEDLTIVHPSNRDGPLGGSATRSSPATAPSADAGAGHPAASATGTSSPAAPSSGTQALGGGSGPAPAPGTSAAAPGAPVPAGSSAAPGPATKPVRGLKPVYVATFDDGVRVTQGNELLMTGDQLKMHFRQKDQPQTPSTRPADAAGPHVSVPVQQPLAGAGSGGSSSISPVAASPAAASPVPATTVASAVESATAAPTHSGGVGSAIARDVPIVVHWTGRLLIVPEPGNPPRPIGPGDAVMELIGKTSAVYAFHSATEDSPASEVRCTKLTYATSDGSALVEGSQKFGQMRIIRQALSASIEDEPPPPTVITSDVLDYVASAHTADLTGIGHAIIPMAPNSGEKPALLDAKWSKSAHFDFLARANDEMAIKYADFIGDVKIDHPQLKLTAQELTLAFNPMAAGAKSTEGSAPALSEVKATDAKGRVDCQMVDSAGKIQEVKCHSLDLHTARTNEGKVLARQVDAVGNVDATDGIQRLTCDDRVQMLLRPATAATRPSQPDGTAGIDTSAVELERMDARGHVIVTSKDGSKTNSDQLLVAMDPDGPNVMMTGDSMPRVTDAKNNTLTGEQIVFRPHQQIAHVVGPGTIHSPGETAKGAAPDTAARKMDVIFSDGADLDGTNNQIKLRGHPVVTMPDSDGTMNTATADSIRIDLQNKPVPATAPVAKVAAPPATRPADDTNLLGNKEPKLITLEGSAQVQSILADAGGILRQSVLEAPRILYAVAATDDIPAHTLVVPSPGKMLVRDHRPPPTTAPAAGTDDSGLGNGRGTTAFKWMRKLSYNEDSRRAIMSGDVLVVHQPDNPAELLVSMTADEMTAMFLPSGKKPSATQPSATQPTTAPALAGGAGAMELKSVEAVGNVRVNRGAEEITAPRIYFEPASHWMTATGTDQTPVHVIDAQGAQSIAREVRWNTLTWDFVIKKGSGQGRK